MEFLKKIQIHSVLYADSKYVIGFDWMSVAWIEIHYIILKTRYFRPIRDEMWGIAKMASMGEVWSRDTFGRSHLDLSMVKNSRFGIVF